MANERADHWESGVFSTEALGLEPDMHQGRDASRPGQSGENGEARDWRLPPSPFPMWIFDPCTGRIVAANDAAAQAYGYTRAELLACCTRDLSDPNDGFSTTLPVEASLWSGTVKQRRKDGAAFDADMAMIETGDAGRPAIMVIANLIPKAARPDGETPSRRTAIRKEVPTPVPRAATPTIRAKTLLGRATLDLLCDEALRERRGESEDSVSHESQAAAGRRAVTWGAAAFVRVDARDLARNVRERVRVQAAEKNSYVLVDCTCGRVWLQPLAFSEALYELLHNAVRATRMYYPVIVDVRETAEGDVLWQVQDAGEGMSDQALAGLGHYPHTTWAEGRGRGVAFAWAVIERHGGLLRFESARGVGTTASIWLPGSRERALAEKTLRADS